MFCYSSLLTGPAPGAPAGRNATVAGESWSSKGTPIDIAAPGDTDVPKGTQSHEQSQGSEVHTVVPHLLPNGKRVG